MWSSSLIKAPCDLIATLTFTLPQAQPTIQNNTEDNEETNSLALQQVPTKYNLVLVQGQLVLDVVRKFMREHNLPVYLEHHILSTVMSLLKLKAESHSEDITKPDSEVTPEKLVHSYENYTFNFAKNREEDTFPKAYQALVLSPFPSIYTYLLELEKKYAGKMREIHKKMEKNLVEIQDRHAIRMERAVERGNYEQDFTNLVSRHVEEMEVAQATWGSAVEETKTKQREEFINFVKILYNKHQEKLAEYEHHQLTNSLEEGNIDKSIFDSAFLEFSEKYSNPTPELGSLMPNVTAQSTESPSSPKIKPPEDPALSKMIAELQEMGFNREQAECALEITNRDAEQAVMLLLENPHAIEVKIHEKRQIQSRKLENNVNRTEGADSPLARKKISGRVNSSDSLSKQAKSWSPMSFLNQRQAQLSSNSNPSVRKLGGWLGRAMENLKMDENETERRQKKEAELVENMTITLGTHVKSKYNVRLQVTDLDALMQTGIEADHITEIHAQTTSSLYSESLSASVLLLELKDWPKYISGKSANQPFFKKCRQTTEFHFDDVETQMKTIQQDFEEPNSPQPGDFFITRHSNLPMIHLVFHLFIGPDQANDINLTQRSPLIMGLRNILKTCQRYDISTVQIPMLLLPENIELGLFSENLVIKRAELILKCMKGFMLENLRFVRPEAQEEIKSYHFMLPKYIQIRQFDTFKSLLGSVFKKG